MPRNVSPLNDTFGNLRNIARTKRKAEKPSPIRSERERLLEGKAKNEYAGENQKTMRPLHHSRGWKSELFIWKKKLEKEGNSHMSVSQLVQLQKRKIKENASEMLAIKKRRLERECQVEARREEKERNSQISEDQFYDKWHQMEEGFFMGQVKLRSELRRKQGRGKPIDYLSLYLNIIKSNSAEHIPSQLSSGPLKYINNMSRIDLEDLDEDIKVYKQVDRGVNDDLWDIIDSVVTVKLQDGVPGRVLNQEVQKLVRQRFETRTEGELLTLQQKIQMKMTSSDVDVSHWEAISWYLQKALAEKRLLKLHLQYIRNQKTVITHQCQSVAAPDLELLETGESVNIRETRRSSGIDWAYYHHEILKNNDRYPISGGAFSDEVGKLESPPPVEKKSIQQPSINALEEDIDKTILEEARKKVIEQLKRNGDCVHTDDVEKGQTSLFDSPCFKPQKPRFSNKLETGFTWNRYNRTHYDRDNPPPKMVTGYKFTVFYPHLLDKSIMPSVSVKPLDRDPDMDPSQPDLAVLHISAGPPYEDVAFKVVNKDWDTSRRSGYQCTFRNGVFKLWFRFRRLRYRR